MGRHEKAARAISAMKRRGVALLGLGMIIAGGIWAAVAMANTRIEITKPSGNSQEIEIREENYDKKNVRYQEGGGYEERSGRSLASVLKQIGVGDKAWASIDVEGLVVRNGDFRAKKPPIFFVRDDDVIFYRPKLGPDSYETRDSNGGNLDIDYRVPLIVESSDDTPKAGQKVTYTASVPDAGPQNAFEFRWTPSSGTGGSGATFKYKYPETSGEVTINLTAKRGSDSQTVGTSTVAATVEAPPADNSGDTGGIGTGGYDSGYNYGYTPPSDFGGDYNTETPNPEQNFPDPPKDTPDDTTLPEATSGTSVSGELLAAVAPLEPSSGGDAAGGEDAASPESTPEDEVVFEENDEVTAPGALIAAGVVVGLIGLGAGREIEDVRPRRFLRRPTFSGLRRLLPPWK